VWQPARRSASKSSSSARVGAREGGEGEVAALFEGAAELERPVAHDAEGLVEEEELRDAARAQRVDLLDHVLHGARLEAERADDAEGAGVRAAVVGQHRGETLGLGEGEVIPVLGEELVPRPRDAERALAVAPLDAQEAQGRARRVAHGHVLERVAVAGEVVQGVAVGEHVQRGLDPGLLREPQLARLVQHVADGEHAPPARVLIGEERPVLVPRHRAHERDQDVGVQGLDARAGVLGRQALGHAVEHRDVVLQGQRARQHHEVYGVEEVVRLGGLRTEVIAYVDTLARRIQEQDLHPRVSVRRRGLGPRASSPRTCWSTRSTERFIRHSARPRQHTASLLSCTLMHGLQAGGS
jgi:hypothetical protein